MALSFQASDFLYESPHAPRLNQRKLTTAALSMGNSRLIKDSIPNLQTERLTDETDLGLSSTSIQQKPNSICNAVPDSSVVGKLHAILDAVADRVEMHKNIGEQRNNWNTLLLNSINAITLAAATMSGIGATNSVVGTPLLAMKISSTLLYISVTGMLIMMNKIQPSQLVEEQRNASRLFKQLHNEIQTSVLYSTPTERNVKEAMEKVLALDKAYPLALLGTMLEKFPSTIEPAVWWPKQQKPKEKTHTMDQNGWSGTIEEEMRQLVERIRRKDKTDYLRLGGKALKLNKILAVTGPFLTGLAALGSAASSHGAWAVILGTVAGALASVVNTLEHGGQVGMVFEMYRCNAGFFKLMEESIESSLMEKEVGRRENGELVKLKVALQLGRSLSELRELASSSSSHSEEFASKLF